MYDINKQCFAVLTFATVSELHDSANDIDVTLQRDAIVEVAAVRIEKGLIRNHFHSFVGIDGYGARDIQFDCGNYGAYGVRAEHLIGAPTLKDVVERLSSFIGDSVLLVHSVSANAHNPFTVFKDCAKSYGYCFNNPTVGLKDIAAAYRLKNAVQSSGADLETASVLQMANMLVDKSENWTDILADYDINFDTENDDMSLRDRNDPLSWALIFAKLFVKLNECDKEAKPDDAPETKTDIDVVDNNTEE